MDVCACAGGLVHAGAGDDVRLSTEERVHDASGAINAASAAPTMRGDLYMLEATRCEPRFRSVCAMTLLISDLQSIPGCDR
jgi:hypothetical protein